MQETHSDFTNTFLAISTIDLPSLDSHSDSCIQAKNLLESCTLHVEDNYYKSPGKYLYHSYCIQIVLFYII